MERRRGSGSRAAPTPACCFAPRVQHASHDASVLTIASDAHRRHHPRDPIHDGGRLVPPPEIPERAERIRAALGSRRGRRDPRTRRVRARAGAARPHARLHRVPDDGARALARRRPANRRRRKRCRTPGRSANQPHGDSAPCHRGTRLVLARLRSGPRRARGRPRPRRSTSRSPLGAPLPTVTHRGVRAVPPARPSRGRRFVRGVLLPQQRRDRRAGVRRSRRARRDPRRRLPPRQRHPAAVLRPRRRAVRLAPRRSRATTIRTSSAFASERGWGAGEGYTRNFPLPPGTDWACLRACARRRDCRGDEVRARRPGRLARRRHRDRGPRLVPARRRRLPAPRRRDRRARVARPCSCKRAATTSMSSAATSSASSAAPKAPNDAHARAVVVTRRAGFRAW